MKFTIKIFVNYGWRRSKLKTNDEIIARVSSTVIGNGVPGSLRLSKVFLCGIFSGITFTVSIVQLARY